MLESRDCLIPLVQARRFVALLEEILHCRWAGLRWNDRSLCGGLGGGSLGNRRASFDQQNGGAGDQKEGEASFFHAAHDIPLGLHVNRIHPTVFLCVPGGLEISNFKFDIPGPHLISCTKLGISCSYCQFPAVHLKCQILRLEFPPAASGCLTKTRTPPDHICVTLHASALGSLHPLRV